MRDEAFLKAIGNKIRLLRMERKWTMLELAVRMDNHPEQLYRIEHGKRNISICTLKAIGEALEIDITELLKFN